MQVFKDNEGRAWVIQIHVAAIKKCRALLDVDLPNLMEDGFTKLAATVADVVKLIDILYVLCQDQANERKVTDEDFGRAMWGDVMESASNAFIKELIDFFPGALRREGLLKVMEASKDVQDKISIHNQTILNQIDTEAVAKQVIAEASAKMLIAASGNAPASSASTPDLLRSAS